ncbi:hypothetical protein SAY87_024947 [Trapa incisa]|uniref:SAM domain-containing protein n=1 Tax=Trapa incisa TaxID=236973 RepID=A0AAN7GQ01_9MYRT|nr:hypothetical protein SAY87_024947 [Trapa incisa]
MTDIPRERVTITLGCSGQVVKRPSRLSDSLIDPLPSAGSKRPIRDRLGDSGDGSLGYGYQLSSKRQRGGMFMPSRRSNRLDDSFIEKDDLRNMLIQKNVHRRAESDEEGKAPDLRQRLVKTVNPPSSTEPRQGMPKRKEHVYLAGHSRIPQTGHSDYSRSDPLRNSYSPSNLERLRRRSPDRYFSHGRARSPGGRMGEIQSRPIMRTSDDTRSAPYVRSGVLHPSSESRPINSTPYMTNTKHPVTTGRLPPPPRANPPPSGSSQRISYMNDEHRTVDGLLNALELGKYAITFKAEEVDMSALKQMGEHDLKELGIPMGPRKKILQAITPRPKRRQ